MIVQSFGTSWKMEDNGTLYMAAMKREIDYARSKSVEVRFISDSDTRLQSRGQVPSVCNDCKIVASNAS